MFSFGNVTRLSYNQTSYPITLADVKLYSKWFDINSTDTSIDTWIESFVIPKAVEQFESSSGYLILDQTFQATIRSLQSPIYQTFQAGLIHLNVRSVDGVLYYPCDWEGVDARTTLDTEGYFFIAEQGNAPYTFNLKSCYLSFYEIQNNIQTSYAGGFEENDFTSLPIDILEALKMYAADLVDIRKNMCDCSGFHDGWIAQTVQKYSRKKYLL
jgi:hypothetical protein